MELSPNCELYRQLAAQIQKDLGCNVIAMDRTNSRNLDILYEAQKEMIAADNGGDPNEQYLFHGTGLEAC